MIVGSQLSHFWGGEHCLWRTGQPGQECIQCLRNGKEASSARAKVWVLWFIVESERRSHGKVLSRGVVRSDLQRYRVPLGGLDQDGRLRIMGAHGSGDILSPSL